MATTNFVDGTTVVEASWLNDVDEVVYETVLKKDGTVAATANIPMGGFTLSNVAAANSANEPLTYGQAGAAVADITATNAATAARFVPTGSTVPANGMYLPAANSVGFSTDSTERARISATGLVGLGMSSSGARLSVLGVNNTTTFGSNGDVHVYSNDQTVSTQYGWNQLNSSGNYTIGRNGTAKAVVEASVIRTQGTSLISSYDGTISVSGSAGDLLTRSSTTAGTVYFGDSANRYIQGSGVFCNFGTTFTAVRPAGDNACDLGGGANRWGTVYAATGTINTSDADSKTEIEDLTAAEKRVAQTLKSKIKRYKFTDAVDKKGSDKARIHVGLLAQDIRDAFVAEGLNPRRYGMFCEDVWYEIPNQPKNPLDPEIAENTPGAVKVTRLGVRYEELLTFIISAM